MVEAEVVAKVDLDVLLEADLLENHVVVPVVDLAVVEVDLAVCLLNGFVDLALEANPAVVSVVLVGPRPKNHPAAVLKADLVVDLLHPCVHAVDVPLVQNEDVVRVSLAMLPKNLLT